MTKHIRQGFGTVRPYLYGAYELPQFLIEVFGAREIERHEQPTRRGAHVELAIGDSVLVVEAGELPPTVEPESASVYVYVEDVDEAYRRAIAWRRGLHPRTDRSALRRAKLRLHRLRQHLVGGHLHRLNQTLQDDLGAAAVFGAEVAEASVLNSIAVLACEHVAAFS